MHCSNRQLSTILEKTSQKVVYLRSQNFWRYTCRKQHRIKHDFILEEMENNIISPVAFARNPYAKSINNKRRKYFILRKTKHACNFTWCLSWRCTFSWDQETERNSFAFRLQHQCTKSAHQTTSWSHTSCIILKCTAISLRYNPGVYNLLLLPATLLLFMWSTAANEFELYSWDTFN